MEWSLRADAVTYHQEKAEVIASQGRAPVDVGQNVALPERTPITTLREFLAESVYRFKDLPALIQWKGVVYSFSDVGKRAGALGALLRSRGIRPGDRIALVSENKPEWGIFYLAVTGMGAVIVPILPDFSAAEIAGILTHADVSAVCVSEALQTKVQSAAPDAPVLQLDKLFSDMLIPEPSAEFDAAEDIAPLPEDLAAILYTSGTTGQPKGVMLSHRNIVQNVLSSRSLVQIGPADRLLSILPLAHTYECTVGFLAPFSCGSAIYYLGKPPTMSVLLPALADVRPTMMMSVPLIMEKLYRSRIRSLFEKNIITRAAARIPPVRRIMHRIAGRKVAKTFGGRIQFFGIGGAALHADTERFLREARFPYSIGYGLTETAPLIAGTGASGTRFRSTGPAVPNVDIRIDHSAGDGIYGEIQVRGPNVMMGYFKNEEATREAFTTDGWLRTGDLGTIDRHGYLYIRGRLKNMIVGPGGENIYPDDIEAAINENDLVVDSLVFEWRGQLVARVHINFDALKERIGNVADAMTGMQQKAEEILNTIRISVNARVNRASRLSRVILEPEPFEKTPTQKIKRFLYTHLDNK